MKTVLCLFAAVVLFAVLLPFCLAATPPAKPAGGATPIVTVTKNDGSTVRGKLTAAGPGSITVEGTGAAAAPVQIAWREIKSVSNGLSQAKALHEFRTEHADELCETCHGVTTVLCATCKGTGHDPASGKECKTCKGELLIDCKSCDEGKMPCPKPCLKLTEGKWEKKEDGLWWRTFKNGKGWWTWSERHLGELIVAKNGEFVSEGPCPTCHGTTTVPCTTCNALGKVPCPTCTARKEAPACPAHCEHGHEICKTCNGTGLKGAPGAPTPAAPTTPAEPKKPAPLPF